LRKTFKKLALEIIPRLPAPLATYCIERMEARRSQSDQWAVTKAKRRERAELFRELGLGLTVLSGPFKGMRYVGFACGSALAPKLLGTYEMEVHEGVEELCRRGGDAVINLGAAEGYYAVGVAMRLGQTRGITFDWWVPAQYWLRRIAYLNGVMGRIQTRGNCTVAELKDAMETARSPIVVCDVEGAEDELLDPVTIPALLRASILVELHDMDKPGVSDRVHGRFEATHDIRQWLSRPRTAEDIPQPLRDRDGRLVKLMDENRQAQQSWFLMTPK